MNNDLSIIILSAGKGSRMKSNLPKVLHKIANRSMIDMVIDQALELSPENLCLVVANDFLDYKSTILNNHQEYLTKNNLNINFIIQEQRLGTGHAVSCAINHLKKNSSKLSKKFLVLYGDTPLISSQTLKKMLAKLDESSLCVLAFEDDEENSYGRLIIDDQGYLQEIIEFKDANSNQRQINLCNSGVMAIVGQEIDHLLSKIDNKNHAQEYYLTDIVAIAQKLGLKRSFIKTNNVEVLGVNSRAELANLEKIKQKQIRQNMLADGVTLLAGKTVFFSYDTKINSDVVIHPNVVFGEGVEIESNVEIKSFCHIEGAKIHSGSVIGPFARIRPNTVIEEDVKIGNFVEIKKSQIKKGAKINHLSYIGDAEIGEQTNIGAGVITCNYDGHNKHQTFIGNDVFVGSNSSLIAPLKIGDKSLIGAGSVITKNVDKDDLAVARALQKNIELGAKKFHQNKSKK
ncbi:MAG: Bifunctional protein GlmU [Pseudomonadota bacterium]|jgi:bifunctional UDP-N-acetylglucosamine pyrophosphorylase/glucosamine-1-phosphate N-acetyltransferase